jgi:hypothetical protein
VLLTYCAKPEASDPWRTLRTMELMKDRLRTKNYKILGAELSKPVLAEAKHFRSHPGGAM